MPVAKRIIPCLDVNKGRVVKGVNFKELKDAGNPIELAKRYSEEGADELVFLDITAAEEHREIMKNVVKNVAGVINIPFTVGGGIKNLEDARNILLSGADRVSINTAAVIKPDLIEQLMSIFGKQCIVVALDVKRNYDTGGKNIFHKHGKNYWFEIKTYGGKKSTNIDAIEWAKKVEKLGAGEILLTSIDTDGTENGYDLELIDAICHEINIPVIASGGCGSKEDILQVFKETQADAALAASLFHFEKERLKDVKTYLSNNNILIRPQKI
jgi:cyclase